MVGEPIGHEDSDAAYIYIYLRLVCVYVELKAWMEKLIDYAVCKKPNRLEGGGVTRARLEGSDA